MLLDHTHPRLNDEITAIGGAYVFLKESTLRLQEKTILYHVGCAVMNSTCCGAGGACFARVSGIVHDLKYKTDHSGAPVSRIEPISDETFQKKIQKKIQDTEMVHQVAFYTHYDPSVLKQSLR